MQLNGKTRKQFHEALLSAFPTPAKLKRMVSFELDENLDTIYTGNYSDVVTELILWAEEGNKKQINVEQLLTAARSANPGNSKLRSFEEQIQGNESPVSQNSDSDFKYDVALSFAGEQRYMAERLFYALKNENIKVFYDENEESELWGQDLSLRLPDIYENQSQYVIIFFSENYLQKKWTNIELKSALKRKWSKNVNNILPLNLDNITPPPEFPDTIVFLPFPNISGINVKRVVDNVKKKLK